MSEILDGVDYGPLAQLFGRWVGSSGLDNAPDANGNPDKTPFTDELTFAAAGAAENAEEQNLVAVRYRHVVRKQANGKIFHDQIGHWLFEPKTSMVMFSLSIPRGVCLLAGGSIDQQGEQFTFDVEAIAGSETFGIVQSPFMKEKARTTAYQMNLVIEGDNLSYQQTTSLQIYGKAFEHVDFSSLQRITYDA